MKVLIVGQNPKLTVNLTFPFRNTPSGKRLNAWIDYFKTAIPRLTYDLVNATDRFDVKPNRYYQSDIDFLKKTIDRGSYDRVIALGNYASNVLTKAKIKHFKLPHPSGLNRRLNIKSYEQGQLDNCLIYLLQF